MITGPNWQWSPTRITCLAPMTMGIRHSGSVAWVLSSMRTCLNRKFASRGSPAPTQVVQITSAADRISRSATCRSDRYFVSSAWLSSPWSSLSCCSFASSEPSWAPRLRTRLCSDRKSTELDTASRLFAQSLTTLSPAAWIFSVSWSTATLEGAATRTCPWPCLARWYTIVAEVTVFPVPGGPWIRLRGFCSTDFTAETWLWFNSGSPATEYRLGSTAVIVCGSTACPRSLWYRYAETEVSSMAKVFIAFCMRSKEVDFHTKSTLKPWFSSTGTPMLLRSSTATSSFAVSRTTWPTDCHGWLCAPPGCLSRSSSPGTRRISLSSLGYRKYATCFLFRPISHRTVMPSLLCASFIARSYSASSRTRGPNTLW
eukprot:RCo020882